MFELILAHITSSDGIFIGVIGFSFLLWCSFKYKDIEELEGKAEELERLRRWLSGADGSRYQLWLTNHKHCQSCGKPLPINTYQQNILNAAEREVRESFPEGQLPPTYKE